MSPVMFKHILRQEYFRDLFARLSRSTSLCFINMHYSIVQNKLQITGQTSYFNKDYCVQACNYSIMSWKNRVKNF